MWELLYNSLPPQACHCLLQGNSGGAVRKQLQGLLQHL